MTITILTTINGSQQEVAVRPNQTLLEFLRGDLSLQGSGGGLWRGRLRFLHRTDRRPSGKLLPHARQQRRGQEDNNHRRFVAHWRTRPGTEGISQTSTFQCGYCTPGMIMTAADLLRTNANPSEEEIKHALEGNLCRCTGYVNIVESVKWAAEKIGGKNVSR